MKQSFILPLLASGLLVACATPTPPVQDKPTVIGQQDIQRMAQQGFETVTIKPIQTYLILSILDRL